MRWFGKAYGAAYEADTPRAAVPVGQLCERCGETLLAGDSGFLVPMAFECKELAYHYECHMRAVIGGLNHLQGACTCCGGNQPPDPEGVTKREAAKMAVAYWYENRG